MLRNSSSGLGKNHAVRWLVVSVVCGILWILVNLVFSLNAIGMSSAGCSYGLISAYGLLFRGRRIFMIFGSMRSEHMILLIIAIGILINIMTPINLIWVAGAGVGYVYVKLCWRWVREQPQETPVATQRRTDGFVDID